MGPVWSEGLSRWVSGLLRPNAFWPQSRDLWETVAWRPSFSLFSPIRVRPAHSLNGITKVMSLTCIQGFLYHWRSWVLVDYAPEVFFCVCVFFCHTFSQKKKKFVLKNVIMRWKSKQWNFSSWVVELNKFKVTLNLKPPGSFSRVLDGDTASLLWSCGQPEKQLIAATIPVCGVFMDLIPRQRPRPHRNKVSCIRKGEISKGGFHVLCIFFFCLFFLNNNVVVPFVSVTHLRLTLTKSMWE